MQEEIKITGVSVYVNPYSEPDEESQEENGAKNERKAEDVENVCFWNIFLSILFLIYGFSSYSYLCCFISVAFQDKVGSWYSNPTTGTVESGDGGRVGVGKYLKAKSARVESDNPDTGVTGVDVAKKRKLGVEFKNFTAW